MAQENYETTDVVICGCGPTGAMLSAYLGRMSIPHIVIEKEPEITTDPRGIALDEDGIRMLQGIGIYDQIYSDIGTCMSKFKFIGGTEKILDKKPFLEMDYGTTEGGTGHVGFICHKQPILEKHLRDAMKSEFCQLHTGASVFEIREEGDHVYSQYNDADGFTHGIRSRFLVGADGKTGFTRKNFLEPLGIHMEQAHTAFYDETWVALNWEISLPNEKTHPDFALWRLGYTPEQVYDLFFPVNFRFVCNPERPAVCGRFGLPSNRLWRFEFVVRPGEDGEEMSKPENIEKVVFPYITHPGSRYGIVEDVQFPEDCIRVLRSRPFRFSARSCNRWSHGRVVLCGDAAHVFPPFGGQGIASGFRDAVSLAWRLVLLCRRQTVAINNHEEVLSGWYVERKQQLERSLAATIKNGEFVTEGNPIKIFIRDWSLFFMHLIPRWRRDFRLGYRKEGLVKYNHSPGLPFDPSHKGGLCLPQVYCKQLGSEKVMFSDDVLFSKEKKGLFQLLVYLGSVDELDVVRQSVSQIEEISKGEIRSTEVTYLIEDTGAKSTEATRDLLSIFRLATAEEFAQSSLCRGRPEPQYYDPLYLGKALEGNGFVVVRPDRFIYAACDNIVDLEKVIPNAVQYLHG
ncbi:hypothetical protein N7508_007193 [Penicillium antarcticum]|uniref:uncharacterized protein n=1 Tax=Penicillium antarcticum TaxID=416450 RepID=UPI0023904F53|nr:uncharacterized protein N7508_007193 [Penicillium antarcticum]KAJ5302330.1 hypothetical protein N7508_007193 [Penicillium antarcticum]